MNIPFRKFVWRTGIVLISLHLISLLFTSHTSAQTCALHNATEQTLVTNDVWGVRADIFYTTPNIPSNPGSSYHRVAVISDNPLRFYEYGWVRGYISVDGGPIQLQTATLMAYTTASGQAVNEFYNLTVAGPVSGTDNYQIKYLPSKNKWRSFFNGQGVFKSGQSDTGFSFGDAGMAGGEALCGNEAFNCVLTYNAQTRGFFGGGTRVWQAWNTRIDQREDDPYNNQQNFGGLFDEFFSHHVLSSCIGTPLPVARSTATTQDYGEN